MKSGKPVVLVEDDAHHIMEVRDFTPGPEVPLPPFFPVPLPEPRLPPRYPWPLNWVWWFLSRIQVWLRWPRWWFSCLTIKRAQQVFDFLSATSCDPLTVPPPCIPFLFPDDGCHARAHEMCRLMIASGLSPRKIWITNSDGHKLHVDTKNNPQCYVEWYWHVAPTLCVRGPGWLQTQTMVIDPALFTTPVSEATWKDAQNDPGATVDYIDASSFTLSGTTDSNYSATNAILAFNRLALQTRSIQVGPPPYANCP